MVRPPRPFLSGLEPEEIERLVVSLGQPAYRSRQIIHAIHAAARLDPAAMTALPAPFRERLAAAVVAPATRWVEEETAEDGTTKLLLGLVDGRHVETVLIPEARRRTVCVSTQVGCPIRCVFCASGVGGLVRNLETAEIVEQPLHVQARIGARPTHVVIMGMGEPLLNLENLARAVRWWVRPEGWGLSPRRITVSTASTAHLVEALLEADLGVNLAVSLHAPDDETRHALVPTSRPGRTEELVAAAARYARETGRDATVEYVLVEGTNDRPEHARRLATLVRGRHLHVNLIPLNPVGHRPDLRAPSGVVARAFAERLRSAGVSSTLRTRRGEDIHAACGQLAMERAVGGRDARPGSAPRVEVP